MAISNLTVKRETLGKGQVLMARWQEDGDAKALSTLASGSNEAAFLAEMKIRLGLEPKLEETPLFKNAMRYQEEWLNARK